jgi:two-component system phosphate regulon response regulator PhoB
MIPEKTAASPSRILVIEDEPDIAALLAFHIARAGYRVSTTASGSDGLKSAHEERPSLVVLDLMLPDMSGFDVLEALRADPNTATTAVLMLTARKEEEDRIRGLRIGADDYVVKPFSPQELVLRIGAILRRARSGPTLDDVTVIGPVQINRETHRVTVGGTPIELTPTEFKLLLTLADRRGRVQPRGRLLEQVWEAVPDVQTRTVDMHVQRLRAKLGPAGYLIETIRGFGYRMRAERDDTSGGSRGRSGA